MDTQPQEQWAIVELMGHDQTAGRIEMGALLRVDVPLKDGAFRTEYIGSAAIFRVRLVSEEIARATATPITRAQPFDAPIVTREQHLFAMRQAEHENNLLRQQLEELRRRLTAVDMPALLQPKDEDPED